MVSVTEAAETVKAKQPDSLGTTVRDHYSSLIKGIVVQFFWGIVYTEKRLFIFIDENVAAFWFVIITLNKKSLF